MSQNTCFIVYKDIGEQSLKEFLEDIEKGIDWYIRLKIATGVAEGLSFLLDRIPNQVSYGSLTLDNIRIDSALNVKLLDFVFLSTQTVYLKEKQHHSLVNSLGNMLLQLFGFLNPPEDGGAAGAGRRCNINKLYPQKDAKVVIDLAASCLLPEPSLCPSIRHVARVLQSIEPTKHVAKYAINRSKSFAYSKTRSLSFG
ncbi:hypothetical protein KP509_20G076500 [Ceratopteris richardii]|nr:hypothetical protein KP509_20G076500 [Ceratopteris richardii]